MNTSVVSDLMLRTTETPSFNITHSLPNLTVLLGVGGKDTLVSSNDLNGNRSSLATLLVSRSVQSSALASEESGYFRQEKENSLHARMPESLKEGSPGRRLRRQEEASSATNGLTFKIVQLADLHISGDPTAECRDPPIEFQNVTVNCTEAITTVFVNSILDMENPDFFVFSGDTVHVPDATLRSAAIETAFLVVEARGIPYAVIMGNHDDDYGFPRQDIMSRIYARNLSYVESGPNHIQGVGNYALAVKAPSDGPWGKQGEPVFRMYFLDSNNLPDEAKYPTIQSEYDWIRPQQIEYYRQLSLSNRVTPTPIPAIMFYHIPVPEYANVSRRSGARGEDIHSPKFNSHLLSTLVELGEVKATFAGPDHTNEFCAKVHDIQPCYGGRTGFGLAYSAPGLLVVLACLNGVSIRKIAVV